MGGGGGWSYNINDFVLYLGEVVLCALTVVCLYHFNAGASHYVTIVVHDNWQCNKNLACPRKL